MREIGRGLDSLLIMSDVIIRQDNFKDKKKTSSQVQYLSHASFNLTARPCTTIHVKWKQRWTLFKQILEIVTVQLVLTVKIELFFCTNEPSSHETCTETGRPVSTIKIIKPITMSKNMNYQNLVRGRTFCVTSCSNSFLHNNEPLL